MQHDADGQHRLMSSRMRRASRSPRLATNARPRRRGAPRIGERLLVHVGVPLVDVARHGVALVAVGIRECARGLRTQASTHDRQRRRLPTALHASCAAFQDFMTTGFSPLRFGNSYLSMQKCFSTVFHLARARLGELRAAGATVFSSSIHLMQRLLERGAVVTLDFDHVARASTGGGTRGVERRRTGDNRQVPVPSVGVRIRLR